MDPMEPSTVFSFTLTRNSTLAEFEEETEDFWANLYQWGAMKICACILNLMTVFVLPFVIYNLIDFISSRHIITIVHRMELGVMWSGMSCISLILFIDALRMIFGPLPTSICWFQKFWRNCPMTGAFFYFDAIAIFRYIYIFVYKSVAPINEDLIARVVYLSVSVWAFLYGVTFMVLPGKLGVNYYMCTGQDPETDPYSFKKFPINAFVPILSLIIYFVLAFKIARFRWTMAMQDAKQKWISIKSSLVSNNSEVSTSVSDYPETLTTDVESSKKSFEKVTTFIQTNKASVSFAAILFVSMACFVDSILWSLVVNKWSPEQIMGSSYAMFVVYWHNDFGIMFYVWVFMILAYLKNPKLVQNARELFNFGLRNAR